MEPRLVKRRDQARPYGCSINSLVRRGCAVFVLALLAGAAHAQGLETVTAEGRPLLETFAPSALSIRTAAQRDVQFDVFLAMDAAQRARGLMYVDHLPDDVGMLFLHDSDHEVAMWMKETRLPLDMLFIDRHGRIVDIVRGTVPYSLATITPQRPARAVLELKAGTALRNGIRVGDRVVHSLFDIR